MTQEFFNWPKTEKPKSPAPEPTTVTASPGVAGGLRIASRRISACVVNNPDSGGDPLPDCVRQVDGSRPGTIPIREVGCERILAKRKNCHHNFGCLGPKILSRILIPGSNRQTRYDGVFWLCYPKGSSKIPADLNRDILRALLRDQGLEAVSQVALDGIWSAMRFRPTERAGKQVLLKTSQPTHPERSCGNLGRSR